MFIGAVAGDVCGQGINLCAKIECRGFFKFYIKLMLVVPTHVTNVLKCQFPTPAKDGSRTTVIGRRWIVRIPIVSCQMLEQNLFQLKPNKKNDRNDT